jgi:hypothetical protein
MTTPNPSAAPAALSPELNYETLLAAARELPADQPIVMMNLLRYRAQADYGPHSSNPPRSGREAYQEYIQAFLEHNSLDEVKVFFQGPVLVTLVAPAAEQWDDIVLVEYRNLSVFRRWVESPFYRVEVDPIRKASLADWRLIMARPPMG